ITTHDLLLKLAATMDGLTQTVDGMKAVLEPQSGKATPIVKDGGMFDTMDRAIHPVDDRGEG
ncbi:MAG: hypothetical protein AAGK74_00340, partial [Chloroflexota bacterium]